MTPPSTPATQTPAVEAMAVEWPKIDALLGGTRAMREAGLAFLPKHPAESEDAYTYRLEVSTLFNGFRRTVETMAGKPFSEPLKIGDDVPPQIAGYADDIDLQGRNLHAFSHEVMTAVLSYGLSHILVDYPTTTPGQTLADQRTSGARPYFVHLLAKQVLGWKSKRINGVETLIQLRTLESVEEDDGEFGVTKVAQVRVIEPTAWRTYRQPNPEEEPDVWTIHAEGIVSLGFIPLATAYGERTGFMTARPPLLDLADLNIEHWQSASDQSNILHVARVPILFAAGFDDTVSIVIGPNAVRNPQPDAKLSYVEHTGAAIGAGAESLKALEERMSLMGAQLLVRRPGSRTATEKAIDTAEADSALTSIVLNLEDSIELALNFVAQWDGLTEGGGTIELCDDYGDGDVGTTGELMEAKAKGVLSAQTVFDELQRRGVISEERTWDDELVRITTEGATVGVLGTFEAPPGASPPLLPQGSTSSASGRSVTGARG